MKTRITKLLGIEYPIVQAGMSWASSCADLPAAVSNAGGLGVLAAGPMYEKDFIRELDRLQQLTQKPFAVNLPLYRQGSDRLLDILYKRKVPVIIASQGGPKAHISRFRSIGTKWLHVVSTLEHANKAAQVGVDGLVVVGGEAGGHPPSNQVSTLVIVRKIVRDLAIPVVAGGGVADGFGIAALLALGADAVQLGTRFLMTHEARVHDNYKQVALSTPVDGTCLVGSRNLPVRMVRNEFARFMDALDPLELSAEEYAEKFARSSLRLAALDGNTDWGKVELGQSVGLIDELLPADVLMQQLITELKQATQRLGQM